MATARKLAKVIYYMLKRNEPFDPAHMRDPELRKAAVELGSLELEQAGRVYKVRTNLDDAGEKTRGIKIVEAGSKKGAEFAEEKVNIKVEK